MRSRPFVIFVLVALSFLILLAFALYTTGDPGQAGHVVDRMESNTDRHPGALVPVQIDSDGDLENAEDGRMRAVSNPSGSARITCQVVDQNGMPVSGAPVSLVLRGLQPGIHSEQVASDDRDAVSETSPSFERREYSDDDGICRFDSIPFGHYLIQSRVEERFGTDAVVLHEGNPIQNLVLILRLSHKLGGTVLDGEGRPVAGAMVMPLANDLETIARPIAYASAVESGSDGRFLFETLNPRTWTLLVRSESSGYAFTRPLEVDNEQHTIVLDAFGALRGFTIDALTSQPVEGIRLEAILQRGDFRDEVAACSNSDGSFEIRGLYAGEYVLRSADTTWRFADGPERHTVTAGVIIPDLKLYVLRGNAVSGTAIDDRSGSAVPRLRLTLRDAVHPDAKVHVGVTDETGTFRFTGLLPGSYVLSAADPKAVAANARVEIEVPDLGNVEGVVYSVRSGLSLSGYVAYEDGGVAANALVEAWSPASGRMRAVTDAGGSFILRGFSAGQEVKLTARCESCLSDTQTLVFADTDYTGLNVCLDGRLDGFIAGQVVTVKGEGIKAFVRCVRSNEDELTSALEAVTVSTDGDGFFGFTVPSPARYMLNTAPFNEEQMVARGSEAGSVQLGSGERRVDLRLVLDMGQTISGRVITNDDRPVPYATVSTQIADGTGGTGGSAMTKTDGTFTMTGLIDGSYTLVAMHPEFLGDRVDSVRAGATGIELRVKPRPHISGRVLDIETQRPVSQFEVRLAHRVNGRTESLTPFQSVSSADGNYTIRVRSLTSRPRFVEARALGYKTGLAYVPDGEPVDSFEGVDLFLEPGLASLTGNVVSSDGNPIAEAGIFEGELPARGMPLAMTGDDGVFTIASMPASATHLSIVADGYAPVEVPVFESTQSENIVITVFRPASIEGEVRRNGIALVGASVRIASDRLRTMTDSEGRFFLGELNPGVHSLACESAAEADSESRDIQYTFEVSEGERATVSLDIPGGL